MAEIFVVNLDSDLDGQYVSDLPVVNSTPVSRQIGFYMGSALTATDSTFNASLVTYLKGLKLTETVTGSIVASSVTVTGNGNLLATQAGTTILTAAEDTASSVTAEQLVCRVIQALAYEGEDLSDLTTLAASIATELLQANAGAATVFSSGQAFASMNKTEFTTGSSANISLMGIMRILAGASPSGVGAFSEGAILGNQRLLGGMRRIYLRDRVEACVYEGSLSLWKQALSFDGSAKASPAPGNGGIQCVIYSSDGKTL